MSLPGDPSPCSITFKVTDQHGGNFRLRRQAVSGTQFFVLDVTNANRDFLDMLAAAGAAYEGGAVA